MQDRVRRTVQDALLRDSRVSRYEIVPFAQGGAVTLEGTVGSHAARRAASEVARNVAGVVTVRNRLRVSRNAPTFHTEAVAQGVRDALQANAEIRTQPVNADVVNRTVYLTGTVSDLRLKRLAARIASSVKGVAAVRNQLVTAPSSG